MPFPGPDPVAEQLADAVRRAPDGQDLVCVGGALSSGLLLDGYRTGLFAMQVRVRRRDMLGWFSPDPRAVIPLDGLHVSQSLRRSRRRFEIRHDTRFADVMVRCGDPGRPGGWITSAFVRAYDRLHRLGWASSVECYDDEGVLVGGLYGVRIERFFAGESMFHAVSDASKVALTALVERLQAEGATLLDVQWLTPHLASLGAVAIPRADYLDQLAAAVRAGPGDPPAGTLA